jgi:EmrB/QacA subfamily drug resistance transporter
MLAVLMFVAGSALCALATSIEMLTAFRVLQGLGGGMLMPVGMTIMTRAAGPERVGRVMAVLGIPMLLGPIFGPILGGWLIDAASWHWIFLINVPIGAGALVYAARVLPRDEVAPSETFDWQGMLLLSPGLALFLFGVSSIPGEGTVWAARVLVSAAIGLVLIVAFVFRELSAKRDHPLLDLHLFTNLKLTIAIVAMALFAIAFFGASLLFPQYFLLIRGEDTLKAGVLLAPQGLGAMLTMPLAGSLTDRIGAGKIVLTGIAVIVIGMLGFTFVGVDASAVHVAAGGITVDGPSYAWLLGSLFVMGLGMGATMMPIMSSALATLKEHEIARGSTLMNITQQVAASIGTALFSVLLTNGFNGSKEASAFRGAAASGKQVDPGIIPAAIADMSHAFSSSFVVAVVLVACCLIPVWFLPRRKAAPVDPAAALTH